MRALRSIALSALLAGALAGCDMIVPPWQKGELKDLAARPVTCTAGNDCDIKWERALRWTKNRTPLKVVTQSDNLIKTTDSPDLSPDPAIAITKTPGESNTYVLQLSIDCGDYLGCVPPLLTLRAEFYNYVMQGKYLKKGWL